MVRYGLPAGTTPPERPEPAGTSLVEVLLVLAASLVLGSAAAGSVFAVRDAARAQQAARRVAAGLHDARSRAITSGRHVAVRFNDSPGAQGWALFADGNGNGVLATDIDRGADHAIGTPRALAVIAPGVQFGTELGTPDVDGAPMPDTSGLRLGTGNWVSFGPDGTSSSGTVYLCGPAHHQYAVRALGPTGRVRVFRYEHERRRWRAL